MKYEYWWTIRSQVWTAVRHSENFGIVLPTMIKTSHNGSLILNLLWELCPACIHSYTGFLITFFLLNKGCKGIFHCTFSLVFTCNNTLCQSLGRSIKESLGSSFYTTCGLIWGHLLTGTQVKKLRNNSVIK